MAMSQIALSWSDHSSTSSSVSTSHTLNIPSRPPLTILFPSLVTARPCTQPSFSIGTPSCSPFSMSHFLTVLSAEQVTSCSSARYTIRKIASSCPDNVCRGFVASSMDLSDVFIMGVAVKTWQMPDLSVEEWNVSTGRDKALLVSEHRRHSQYVPPCHTGR